MFKQFCTLIMMLLFSSAAFAHRRSHIDNLKECEWNEIALTGSDISTTCNDLYHLYESKKSVRPKSGESLDIAAFNIFKLGSGDSRYKDLELTASLLNRYDLISVSEIQPSASEEYESNYNLLRNPQLSFKDFYHKPGYLKLLIELRKKDSSWSLILSPSGQSDTQELLGFYFKANRVQLENSDYCEDYSRKLRGQGRLTFASASGETGPRFERAVQTPHLYKSYGCLMDIENNENEIFRVPFTARFKVGSGFDFQYLSYHARFQEPISIGGSCGYECLEKISLFLNKFHKKGSFIGTVDYEALKFLKYHLDFLKFSRTERYALMENYGSVIRFKTSKPRVYKELIRIKNLLKEELPKEIEKVWTEKYKDHISKSDLSKISDTLVSFFSSVEGYASFKEEIRSQEDEYKNLIVDTLESGIFKEIYTRANIWTSPDKIARFFELSLVLDEMEKISSKEKDTDVLLGGDLNLENDSNEYFWTYLKEHNAYSNVAIGSPTSISDRNGLKSSYDHFMYDSENSLEECLPLEASVLDFVGDHSLWRGFEHYFVSSDEEIKTLSETKKEKLSDLYFISTKGEIRSADEINDSRGYKSCWTGETIKNQPLSTVWQKDFECKTLYQYMYGPDRYRVYTDLISDHIPIEMRCSKLRDLD